MDSSESKGFSFAEERFGVLETASLVESVIHSWGFLFFFDYYALWISNLMGYEWNLALTMLGLFHMIWKYESIFILLMYMLSNDVDVILLCFDYVWAILESECKTEWVTDIVLCCLIVYAWWSFLLIGFFLFMFYV